MLALAILSAGVATRASAGAVGTAFVNSTANTDDGRCDGPPNNGAIGNCTLREAINRVNLGQVDTIKFHPTIFPKAAPGVIDLETVGGHLPPITREVTIDNTGTAVVLDCDAQNDQSWGVINTCDYGLEIDATHNGFDFTLIGGKQFTIREIAGDGIDYFGGSFSAGDVNISGVVINVNDTETNADGGSAIWIEATNLNNIDITNSNLAGDDDDDGDNGVYLKAFANADDDLFNNNVDITENRIYGGNGVFADFFGDLWSPNGLNGVGHAINANVNHNESIIGDAGDAASVSYCRDEGGNCDARFSTINFNVQDNGKISSNDDDNGIGDGVRLTVRASKNGCALACNEQVTTKLNVIGNAIIDSDDDDGVRIIVDICCAQSDSSAKINVTNNSDVVGDDEGVDINSDVGQGPHNLSEIHVDDNGEIIGEGHTGVDVETLAGSNQAAAEPVDADENTAIVSVSRNHNIAGDNDDGVEIDAAAGKEGGEGDADRNITKVDVVNNGNVDGDDDGINVNARAGTEDGAGDADNNDVMVNVSGNGSVDGAGDEGLDIEATAGHVETDNPANATGDSDSTEVLVDGNQRITGHDGHGVKVNSWAGGVDSRGDHNTTSTTIVNNADIVGQGGQQVAGGEPLNFDNGSDGVHIDSAVCCHPSNVNRILIDNNHNITGRDGDGVDIDRLCCSVNFVTITRNSGVIKGNDDNGIEISPCLENGDPEDVTTVNQDDISCMGDSVTELVVTGNNISNSGRNGILACCGAFEQPLNQAPTSISGLPFKSVIANNTIAHNGEDGIDLDTTIGINVQHNQIFGNGTSATDGDNGVEIDWQFGWQVWDDTGGLVKIPAHFNRISQNTIYDNVGLGINLIGAVDGGGGSFVPGSGTEFAGGLNIVDGVGCLQLPGSPIAPNDCLAYPKFLFSGGVNNKLGGTACGQCLVEVFYADDTPADQTGPLGRQHGEGKDFILFVQADSVGNFSAQLPCGLAPGLLTATATDKLKNTSEFAANIVFPGTPPCATATPTATNTPLATNTLPPTPTSTPAPPTNTPVPPTATPVPPTATPAKPCGDVNDDGLVNAVDAQLVLQFKVGMIPALVNPESADVNRDGQITAVDAELILQKASGEIPQSALHCS